jgi:antitoxin (DNA-binding transcriptional repressor) of toxin-antitoxin stability system
MRVTGIREFRNRVPELVGGDELVFVTKHGKLSGLLIPLGQPDELPVELRQDLLERLGAAISKHLDERGVTEKQVMRDFETWKKKRRARRRRQ